VWLLPPPVERTSELSKALSPKDLSPDFLTQVQKLRHALAQQLKVRSLGPSSASPTFSHASSALGARLSPTHYQS
jgi:hypothetical protein